MGALFSNCAVVLARRKARSRGQRCIAILKETEVHLGAMQQKYQLQLEEVDEAIAVGVNMPNKSRIEKEARKDRLLQLLKKRKVLRHYLSVCRKRNTQMLAKSMAIEQLEINSMQLEAIKSTAEAFESFSRKTGGLDSIEDAAEKLSEHMETLAEIDTSISDTLPLGFDDDDDDELLAQLAQYEDIHETTSHGNESTTINISVKDLGEVPNVPSHIPSAQRKGESDVTPLIGVEKVLEKTPIAL